MIIKYKILSIDTSQHSIVVRYFTDQISEEMLATTEEKLSDGSPARCQTDYNINIWKINSTLEEIEEIIYNSAPAHWFKLKNDILNPTVDTSLSIVRPLLGETRSFNVTEAVFSEQSILDTLQNI